MISSCQETQYHGTILLLSANSGRIVISMHSAANSACKYYFYHFGQLIPFHLEGHARVVKGAGSRDQKNAELIHSSKFAVFPSSAFL